MSSQTKTAFEPDWISAGRRPPPRHIPIDQQAQIPESASVQVGIIVDKGETEGTNSMPRRAQ